MTYAAKLAGLLLASVFTLSLIAALIILAVPDFIESCDPGGSDPWDTSLCGDPL